MRKNKRIVWGMLAVLCCLNGCKKQDTESADAQTISVLMSSQDADGYVYEVIADTVYAKQDVNVRSEATSKSDQVALLKKGEKIERIAYNYSWSKVLYEGQTCYIATQYLTTTAPAEKTDE